MLARFVALPSSAWKVKVSRKPTQRGRPKKPKRRSRTAKTPPRKRKRGRLRPLPSSLPTVKAVSVKIRKPRKPKRPPKWKQQEELQKLAYKFTREHGLPAVKVVTHPKKGMSTVSYLKTSWKQYGRGGPKHQQLYRPHGIPEIHISTAGSPLRAKGTLYHELGHLKQKYSAYQKHGYAEYADISQKQSGSPKSVWEEVEAWKVARPYLTSPIQHWHRRLALATHKRQVRYTGDPVHPFVHRDAPMIETEAKRFVASIKVR